MTTVKNYKYNEDETLDILKVYIDSTYSSHYSKNKSQATEFIIDCGYGEGFCIGNIIKYAQRFGKKSGRNKRDIMKLIHYAIILLSIEDTNVGNPASQLHSQTNPSSPNIPTRTLEHMRRS